MQHTGSQRHHGKTARLDTAFDRTGLPQFARELVACDTLRQSRILIDFLRSFLCIRGTAGRRTYPLAVVADHGQAVHIIVNNPHADAKGLGAFRALKGAASRIVNIRTVSRRNHRNGCRDFTFIIQ